MFLQFILLFAGMILIWAGAELLVRYSSRLARVLGVSPIIIGLSVVSMGTSMPELVVSTVAAIKGNTGISIGNIVGSNIANMGLMLGLGAVLHPMEVKISWIKKEVPFMVAVTVLFIIFSYIGLILSPFDGILLLLLMCAFIVYLGKYSIREMTVTKQLNQDMRDNTSDNNSTLKTKIFFFFISILGAVILILGSEISVRYGTKIASAFGVSELVIGLTLIAVGTSLPELATTIVAAIKKETDIIIGNIIGSNIFNILLIGGVASIIRPIPVVEEMFTIQYPILLLLSIMVFPLMWIRLNLQRIEGTILLLIYIFFIYFTIQDF
jgi:cation:H+ antiporter